MKGSEKVLSSDAVSQDWDVAFAFSGYDPERSGYYMGSICCLSEGSTVISISEMDFEKEYEIQYNFSITVSGNRFVAPCYRDPDCYWNCAVAPNSAAVLDTTVEVNGHMDKYVRSLCYVSQAYRKYEPDEFYREYSQVPLVSVTTSDPDIVEIDGDYMYFRSAGEAYITVSCEAGYDGGLNYMAQSYTYKVTVEAEKPDPVDVYISTNVSSNPFIGKMGMTNAFLVYVTDGNFNDIPGLTLTYESSNTDVATIENAQWNETYQYYEFSIASGDAFGESTITISFAGNDTYNSASTSFVYKLIDPQIIVKKEIKKAF